MFLCKCLGKSIKHCFRESNWVAHELARKGSTDPPNLWTDVPPDFILLSLANDVSVFVNE